MALKKEIKQENGIVLNYHRIGSINKITNKNTVIEVLSYLSRSEREKEVLALKNNTEMNILLEAKYFEMQYSEDTTIEEAYNYLKTLEEFKNSVNV